MESGFWQRGGVWAVIQWLLMPAFVAAGPIWREQWSGNVSVWIAVPLFLAGALFGITAKATLGRYRTIFPQPLPDSQLVRHGPYAIVRHPLYTSLVLLSLAWALGWRSFPGLGLALAMFVLLDAKARLEERLLREKFPDYDDYASRVKRLFPWLY
ncbi:S-isoprenylcysteine carboxyl-methyltransferase [Haloferula helveola]|uniref:S-isoprenylcysteine carboxyl-methyltransferase n=1 Tax=Haloferula helveola TaxID=490095 RepID=A0ABM7RCL9_9BACT|nr:S-isoprenylcysteine carboxyl-methyltransferase [Haloferula helveola]